MRLYECPCEVSNSVSGAVPKEFMDHFLRKVDLKDEDFNVENFKPGSSGEPELLNVLQDTRP